MEPFTEALASLGPSIIGSKQLGAAAPAFQPGQSSGVGGLLSQLAQGDNNFGQPFVPVLPRLLMDLNSQQGQSELPTDTTFDESDPGGSMAALASQNNFGTPDQPEKKPGFGGLISGAFDNLDQNLQSPAKVLGLGLLSQIDPRLAQGGLLAGALFGKNKLF